MRGDSHRPVPNHCVRLLLLAIVAMAVCAAGNTVSAQEGDSPTGPRFAPGVLTTIAPEVEEGDTVEVHDIVELRVNQQLERDPVSTTKSRTLFELAKDVDFRREVWCLEIAFKPLRMIHVDVPQPSGKMQRKLVWYLVYRVRNTGVGLAAEVQEGDTFITVTKPAESVRFIPQFVLSSQDRDRSGQRVRKDYLDRIIPAALQAIESREMPSGQLLNSVQMSDHLLKVETGRSVGGLWGVAMWEDVDPQIDYFSVFVGGLTNAYRWKDAVEQFQLGDPPGKGRQFQRKQLQLNFWRPGDAYAEDEREIRFGAPPAESGIYGTPKGVAYRWVYR